MSLFVDMQSNTVREFAWIIPGEFAIELISSNQGFETFATWNKNNGWDLVRTVELVEGCSAEDAFEAWNEVYSI